MPGRVSISPYHLAERLAIKLEPYPSPTPLQEHTALNECLAEFKELYGEFEIVQWPRFAPNGPPSRTT